MHRAASDLPRSLGKWEGVLATLTFHSVASQGQAAQFDPIFSASEDVIACPHYRTAIQILHKPCHLPPAILAESGKQTTNKIPVGSLSPTPRNQACGTAGDGRFRRRRDAMFTSSANDLASIFRIMHPR